MTWIDKLELGLKEDAAYRKDNLPPSEVRGPQVDSGTGRSPEIPMARGTQAPVAPPQALPDTRDCAKDVVQPRPVVALFNASDDTVEMVQRMLDVSGIHCLVSCHFADLRKGTVNFAAYLLEHQPQVVIFDISPPYEQNWTFFRTLRDNPAMNGRGLVLTTTNKDRLDEVVGHDSSAIEIVGKPYDRAEIMAAIDGALQHRS